MSVSVLMIITTRTGLFLVLMTGGRMRAVALVRLRHFLHPAAITQITSAKTEYLRTRHGQNSQQRKEVTCEE